MNKKDNELENLSYLLDPEISTEEINNIIFEGNALKLYKLSQNAKFKDIDSDALLSMSKVHIPFYQNNDYQILFIIGILIISLIINGFQNPTKDPTNLSLLIVLGYLFWKSKDYKKKLINLEKERLIHIQKILKDTEFTINHLIDENIWNTDEQN